MLRRIYTIWPSDLHGEPGGSWNQQKRWFVLDVTEGLDNYEIVDGPMPRAEALARELDLRSEQTA